ncbi:MAG TPA: M20/M25/M40 family metallo-hydrolase [Chloroflexia bacterium]|nr:M20/M25/M40 family metallo-hydrolase [Chloroflexia bacterium]
MTNDPAGPDQHPVALLQRLIQFDTTNPPGDEAACIAYINNLLVEAGIETTLLARDPSRLNLLARLPGRGQAPPLLLQGHVDVVTTAHQTWQYPPFEGRLVDDYIWGRGALDMKGGVAMMIAAVLRAKAEHRVPPGDVLLLLVSDEEAFGEYGARYLVEEHAGLFAGVRYALGEFGGFTLHLGGRRFYPIQVAEKQHCRVLATVRGPGGHAAQPIRGGAMARLGRLLGQLDTGRLPVHITPVVQAMIEALVPALPPPLGTPLHALLDPLRTDAVLDQLGPESRLFNALLHHTASPTIVRGGDKSNVIPSQIVLELDGRTLPGYHPADLAAELQALLGPEVALEVTGDPPGPATPDLGLFPTLAAILQEGDPEGIPIPYLMPAVTDGRYFARLGIQTYGFLPMRLPAAFNFDETIHAADERIPVEGLLFGTEALYQVLGRFGGEGGA